MSAISFLPRVPEDQESVVAAEEAFEENEKQQKELQVGVDGSVDEG